MRIVLLTVLLMTWASAQSLNSVDSTAQTPGNGSNVVKTLNDTVAHLASPSGHAPQALRDTQSLGSFTRKSITFLPLLWRLDQSAQRMDPSLNRAIINAFQQALVMPRFDINRVPRRSEDRFVDMANEELTHNRSNSPDLVANVLNQTIVADIAKVVDLDLNARAQGLMTEAEKNSFIVDKAKDLGYTADEAAVVRNSAYIIIPVAANYRESADRNGANSKIDVGLLIYRIVINGSEVKALPIFYQLQTAQGISGERYRNGRQDARADLVENAAENMRRMLRSLPEFKVTGRIVHKFWTGLDLDIGSKEGLQVDDKYFIVEQREQADGTISSKEVGWAVVQDVGNSKDQKSHLRLVSGSADEGMAVNEYPRLPFEMVFAYWKPSSQFGSVDTNKFGQMSWNEPWGISFDMLYDLGRTTGLSQFFFDFGLGFAPANFNAPDLAQANGYDFSGAFTGSINFGLQKRFFPLPYLSLDLGADLSYRYSEVDVSWSDNSWSNDNAWYQGSLVGYGKLGLNLVVSPTWHIGASVSYPFLDANANWRDWSTSDLITTDYLGLNGNDNLPTLVHKKPEFQIYLNWNPGSVPFNPASLLRAIILH